MLKAVYTTNDKKKNNKLVNVIKSKLMDEEKEIKKPNEIIDVVEKIIIEFNKQNQSGQGLKILTPDQNA